MKELILKDIQPLNSQILTTANKYEAETKMEMQGRILKPKEMPGEYKHFQTILAVGPQVRQVKPGDVIEIDPTAYIVYEHPEDEKSIRGIVKVRNVGHVELPIIEIDGEERCLLQERDARYIIKSYIEK